MSDENSIQSVHWIQLLHRPDNMDSPEDYVGGEFTRGEKTLSKLEGEVQVFGIGR